MPRHPELEGRPIISNFPNTPASRPAVQFNSFTERMEIQRLRFFCVSTGLPEGSEVNVLVRRYAEQWREVPVLMEKPSTAARGLGECFPITVDPPPLDFVLDEQHISARCITGPGGRIKMLFNIASGQCKGLPEGKNAELARLWELCVKTPGDHVQMACKIQVFVEMKNPKRPMKRGAGSQPVNLSTSAASSSAAAPTPPTAAPADSQGQPPEAALPQPDFNNNANVVGQADGGAKRPKLDPDRVNEPAAKESWKVAMLKLYDGLSPNQRGLVMNVAWEMREIRRKNEVPEEDREKAGEEEA